MATAAFSTETREYTREDGSVVTAYFDAPKNEAYPIALVIQGAQVESASRLHNFIKKSLLDLSYGVLTLEKKGIKGDAINDKEYARSHSLQLRLEDHLLALEELKTQKGWNGQLALIGQGEGGKIAASLAHKAPAAALALISAGGAWPQPHETLASFRAEMAQEQYSPLYIHNFIVQAKGQFENARQNPSPDLEAFGFSYRYWDSLMEMNLLNDLLQTKCPIFYVHGDQDDRIPCESVDALQESLKDKKDLTIIRKEEAGHEILADPEIYEEIATWLEALEVFNPF